MRDTCGAACGRLPGVPHADTLAFKFWQYKGLIMLAIGFLPLIILQWTRQFGKKPDVRLAETPARRPLKNGKCMLCIPVY